MKRYDSTNYSTGLIIPLGLSVNPNVLQSHVTVSCRPSIPNGRSARSEHFALSRPEVDIGFRC